MTCGSSISPLQSGTCKLSKSIMVRLKNDVVEFLEDNLCKLSKDEMRYIDISSEMY